MALALTTSLALVGSAAAQGGSDDNRGTIKIHDDPVATPDERNEPHVSCDFYVEGFNMKDPMGHLKFIAWPPTGDKDEVTPTGDTLQWTGTPDGDEEWNFMKGPYQLPAGHYRLEAYTDDGHPGHEAGHFAKAKMFWVDPCGGTPPTPPTPPDVECPEDVPAEECDEVVVPFFTSPASLVLAGLGAAGSVLYVVRRRS